MTDELSMLADKIKILREKRGITQSELSKQLGLTRSGVNGWEMGLSIPSTPMLVELSRLFHVSVDYLLGLENNASLNIDGLSEKQVAVLSELIECFKEHK